MQEQKKKIDHDEVEWLKPKQRAIVADLRDKDPSDEKLMSKLGVAH